MERTRIKLWPSKGFDGLLVGGLFKPCLAVLLVWNMQGVVAQAGSDSGATESAQLECQVRTLSEALVAAKVEIDMLKSRFEGRSGGADSGKAEIVPAGTVRKIEYLILDVNKELGMVILNGGRRDGVKPGLMFDVVEGDKSVTTVRVVDARADIAGAVIQNADREIPKVQDRAVVAAGLKN